MENLDSRFAHQILQEVSTWQDSLEKEMETALYYDKPYIFYVPGHGFCISTKDVIKILQKKLIEL